MELKTFKQFLAERVKTYDFSSTYIDLPHELSQSLIHWGREEIANEELFEDPEDPSFGREKNPHITVLYGLLAAGPEKFRYFFTTQKTVPIKLGRISIFDDNERFDVVKVEVTSPELRQLNAALREKFPHHQTYQNYRPHATIAYVKKGNGDRHKGSDFFLGQEFRAKEIIFSARTGEKYTMSLGGRKKTK